MKHIIPLCLLLLSFYLGLHEGWLAIFEDEKPVIILPYRANLYPTEDQKRLRQGIPFEGSDELSSLLEDFIS